MARVLKSIERDLVRPTVYNLNPWMPLTTSIATCLATIYFPICANLVYTTGRALEIIVKDLIGHLSKILSYESP